MSLQPPLNAIRALLWQAPKEAEPVGPTAEIAAAGMGISFGGRPDTRDARLGLNLILLKLSLNWS